MATLDLVAALPSLTCWNLRDPQQDFSPGYPILSQYLSMIPWDTCD